MAKAHDFKVGFYYAEFDGERKSKFGLHDVLRASMNTSVEDRTLAMGDDNFLLTDYHELPSAKGKGSEKSGLWILELVRLREEIIGHCGSDGILKQLKLPNGRFPANWGHALVVPQFKVVLYHGSPRTVSWTQLRRYVETLAARDEPLHMLPVPSKTEIEKLERIKHPRRTMLKMSRPDKWGLVEDESLKSQAQMAKAHGADWLSFEYGSDRPKKSHLSVQAISRLLKSAWNFALRNGTDEGHELLPKAEISGFEDEDGGERVVADLMKGCLRWSIRYDGGKLKTIEQVKPLATQLLQQAFTAHYKDLETTYNSLSS